ncbi:MAG: glycosyltransferase [Candidatus Moranbacteria bacterium]|nr:glycosyltransferase [Candidatus Moranbacteria bacterium]
MKKPLVSVVLPTYNHEKYIRESILSVLNQTYDNFELIIVDDGSSDNTFQEVKKIKDKRIKTYRFKKNKGASAAANYCIKKSRGKYISMLNSDDVFLETKLERQVDFLEKNKKYGAVFGLNKLIDEEGEEINDKNHLFYKVFRKKNRSRFKWLNHFFYKSNCLCHPCSLVRRFVYDKIGYFDRRLAQLPDFDLWVRLCLNYDIFILEEELIKYRVRENSSNISANRRDSYLRVNFEKRYVLDNFLKIESLKTFEKIFPKIKIASNLNINKFKERDIIKFLLSNEALKIDSHIHQLFAMQNFYDLLGSGSGIKLMRENNFNFVEFNQYTGKIDLFNYYNRVELKDKIEKQEEVIRRLKSSKLFKLQNLYLRFKWVLFHPKKFLIKYYKVLFKK